MSPLDPRRHSRMSAARAIAAAVAILALAGCSVLTSTPPAPTPGDFQGIAAFLARDGVHLTHIVSGDAGCDDITLERTAIGLDADGLDQASPVRLHLYSFRNRDAFDRLRPSIDACARSYVTDPEAFESIESSPFVVAGQGPWGPEFRAAIRSALSEASGTGN